VTKPFTIIFDLDGTLVDTAADLTATLNVILAEENCASVPLQTTRPLIGKGARALIEKGLQLNNAAYDDTRLALLTERFVQYYSAHIADHSTAHPDLRAALDGFLKQGFKLGVCTNKRTPLAMQLLQAVKLDHYFKAVIGSGELPFSKPDPRMLYVAISECGGAPDRAVLVGDNETDVETARAAKVPIILVDFGYTSVPVRELGADAVISDWAGLWPAIRNLKSEIGNQDH
jgi:phosphoglycolate phosphatase